MSFPGHPPIAERLAGGPTPDWVSPCGTVVLYNADCLKVLPELPEGLVDAVVTDPPYGIVNQFGEMRTWNGRTNKGVRKLQWDWDTQETVDTVRIGLTGSFRLCNKAAACVVYCGFDTAERYAEPARRAGFTVKPLAWVKECPPPAGKGNWWPSGFELGYYGYRGAPWFGDTDAKRVNVWRCDSYRYGQPGKCGHPTQKPLRLIERQLTAVVPPGGAVIDAFAGSGTTLIAAARHGRQSIGVEISPDYFAIAVRRIEAELNRFPLFTEPAPQQSPLFPEQA